MAVSKVLLLVICVEVLFCKRKLVKLKKYSWLLLLLSIIEVFIISFIMGIFALFYDIKKDVLSVAVLMSLVVILFLFCFYFLFEAMKMWEQKTQNEVLKTQISTQNQMFDKQDEDIRQIRRIQHDMKHKLVVLEQLLSENNYESAHNYTLGYLKDLEKVGGIDCKETVWKTLLSMKQNKAQKKGIQFLVDIKDHGIKKINAIDFCILLGNLMDNAIEAQEKVVGEKVICFTLREEGLIFIQVKNKIHKNEGGRGEKFITTKSDARLHGFGVTSVKEIVDKYGGIYKFESNEEWFQVEIIF